jgi:hypothetical protein
VLDSLDADAVRRWCATGLAALRRHQHEIDELNVFPVPDGDTGTNLSLTLRAAAEALAADPADTAGEAFRAWAKGAVLGARGNSGVIVSQVLCGLADGIDGSILTGGTFANGVGGTLNTGDATIGMGAVSSLVFDPAVVTLVLDSPTANKVATYTLTATLRDGTWTVRHHGECSLPGRSYDAAHQTVSPSIPCSFSRHRGGLADEDLGQERPRAAGRQLVQVLGVIAAGHEAENLGGVAPRKSDGRPHADGLGKSRRSQLDQGCVR